MKSRLSDLQHRILEILARGAPGWSLSGGAALAGFYLGHRSTDDLDLFYHGQRSLTHEPRLVEDVLVAAGFDVRVLVRSPGFVRLLARDASAQVVVDLVAEPVPVVEPPMELQPGLRIDAAADILVNKLCALVSRSELRDLEDVRALVASGLDLDRALDQAPSKDGGFSPMTLAWLLPQLDLARAAELGLDPVRLERFRERLLAKLDGGGSR